MGLETSKTANESRIRELIDDWAQAVRDKDIDRLMSHYAPDMVAFDAWGPLHIDTATTRDHWEQCFAGHDGPIGFEVRELNIAAGEDVAFCHFLIGMSGRLKDGTENRFWGRGTTCFQNIGGRWLVTHGHASAPFDPYTGKACTNLTP